MGEIDVTKVTAIEYLRKFVKIRKQETCDDNLYGNCYDCKYNNVSCLNKSDYINLDIKDHIQRVMAFELPESKIDWTKVKKDTLIEVRDFETEDWNKRYFPHYHNDKVFAYIDGRTSKTETFKSPWEYARLVEDDNE